MKRFLIPAVLVIDVGDSPSPIAEKDAVHLASLMQEAANRTGLSNAEASRYMMLDEKLPNREVKYEDPRTHELPGSYATVDEQETWRQFCHTARPGDMANAILDRDELRAALEELLDSVEEINRETEPDTYWVDGYISRDAIDKAKAALAKGKA